MTFDRAVILVQGGFHQEDGGDAAGHLLHPADLIFGQRAAQQLFLAVGEPFLDDLVAADGVFPNPQRDVLPVGHVVQVDIAGAVAQQCSAGVLARCGMGILPVLFLFAGEGRSRDSGRDGRATSKPLQLASSVLAFDESAIAAGTAALAVGGTAVLRTNRAIAVPT